MRAWTKGYSQYTLAIAYSIPPRKISCRLFLPRKISRRLFLPRKKSCHLFLPWKISCRLFLPRKISWRLFLPWKISERLFFPPENSVYMRKTNERRFLLHLACHNKRCLELRGLIIYQYGYWVLIIAINKHQEANWLMRLHSCCEHAYA